MSLGLDFKIVELESTFLDPRDNYEPTTIKFQVRMDPLTGRTGHFSHFGAIKPEKLDLESYIKPEIKGFCPFCLDKREKVTPKFTKDIVPDGRLSRGEATLVPNLFPYDIYSGVLIMTDEHVVPISGFNEDSLRNAISLGIEFLRKIEKIDPSLPYHLMTWNYMPPSGGGLVHPHQQYFATHYPGNQFMDELRASADFYRQYGNNFWHRLIEEEANKKERFIGQIGSSHWLSAFVSFSMLGDILCVFPDVFSLSDFNEEHIDDLVRGLLKMFCYYELTGIYSFNGSLFFGPPNQKSFSCHLRISPRIFLNTRDFASDMNFFQAILAEPICVVLPEAHCSDILKIF